VLGQPHGRHVGVGEQRVAGQRRQVDLVVHAVQVRRDGQPTLVGQAVHQPSDHVGDPPRLVQDNEAAAHGPVGLRDGQAHRATVGQLDDLGSGLGHPSSQPRCGEHQST
jgi:hypothetical protein